MQTVYLGFGSNKGERISYIERALEEIRNLPGTEIFKRSSVYETEPWGKPDQDLYLNCVTGIYTELKAEELLNELKRIEKKTGRTENNKWSEREIDIDLLFYGDDIIETGSMSVPHRQIENRNFVLIPMNEIAPDLIHPVFKKSISKLLKDTDDKLRVYKYKLSRTEK